MRRINLAKKFKAAALATLVATMPLLSVTGCFDGGSKGGSSTEDVSNDNDDGDTGGDVCTADDPTCDDGGDTGGDVCTADDPTLTMVATLVVILVAILAVILVAILAVMMNTLNLMEL
jgi:hypothetical protein